MSALGKRLVRSLIAGGDVAFVRRAGVDETCLRGEAVAAFRWAVGYFETSGGWPTPSMIAENVGVLLPDEPEPLEYVVDLVRRRAIGFRLVSAGERLASRIKAREVDEAVTELEEELSQLRGFRRRSSVYSFCDGAVERASAAGLRGLSSLAGFETRWPTLNRLVQGWVNGTLNVVVAMQNTGKTWWLCLNAEDVRAAGKRVLFISLEMSVSRIVRRLDALRHRLPFGELRDGTLDWWSVRRWGEEAEKGRAESGDIIVADKSAVRTVADAAGLFRDELPDIVIVDGGYRFEGRGSGGNWEKTVTIVNDLQVVAEESGVPWLVSSQMGDSHETGKTPRKKKTGEDRHLRAWNVRYGKEWLINPDTVVGLFSDDDLRCRRRLGVQVLKMRDSDGEASKSVFYIAWDLSGHRFDESGSEDAASAESEDVDF